MNRCGKVRYRTHAEARRAARLSSLDMGEMRAYRCRVCDYFHIGHRQPEPEVTVGRVLIRRVDGLTEVARGGWQEGSVDVQPCQTCGLKLELVTQSNGDGTSTADWACPDGHA